MSWVCSSAAGRLNHMLKFLFYFVAKLFIPSSKWCTCGEHDGGSSAYCYSAYSRKIPLADSLGALGMMIDPCWKLIEVSFELIILVRIYWLYRLRTPNSMKNNGLWWSCFSVDCKSLFCIKYCVFNVNCCFNIDCNA